MSVSRDWVSKFVKCDAALDLLPLLLDGIRLDNFVSAPQIVSLDSNECSAVRANVLVVSEAPLLGTGENRQEAATDESKCAENEAHDVRELTRAFADLCDSFLLAFVANEFIWLCLALELNRPELPVKNLVDWVLFAAILIDILPGLFWHVINVHSMWIWVKHGAHRRSFQIYLILSFFGCGSLQL